MIAPRHAVPLMMLLLGGCMAEQGSFPSLAPRPVESIDLSVAPATASTPVAPDPAQAAFAAGIEAQAAEGQARFAKAADEAEPAIRAGAGAAVGSDRWTQAQIALSRVQAARAPLADALGALEERRVTVDDPALDAALARVSALDGAQSARMASLSALLAAPR